VRFAESWCFKYTIVGKLGGSNTSRESESIVLIEAGGFCWRKCGILARIF